MYFNVLNVSKFYSQPYSQTNILANEVTVKIYIYSSILFSSLSFFPFIFFVFVSHLHIIMMRRSLLIFTVMDSSLTQVFPSRRCHLFIWAVFCFEQVFLSGQCFVVRRYFYLGNNLFWGGIFIWTMFSFEEGSQRLLAIIQMGESVIIKGVLHSWEESCWWGKLALRLPFQIWQRCEIWNSEKLPCRGSSAPTSPRQVRSFSTGFHFLSFPV